MLDTLRLLWKLQRSLEATKKEWQNMNPHLLISKTVWGVILWQIGDFLARVGETLQGGEVQLIPLLLLLVEKIGIILAAIGGRDAIAKGKLVP